MFDLVLQKCPQLYKSWLLFSLKTIHMSQSRLILSGLSFCQVEGRTHKSVSYHLRSLSKIKMLSINYWEAIVWTNDIFWTKIKNHIFFDFCDKSYPLYLYTWSARALHALTSCWRPFAPLYFFLRALLGAQAVWPMQQQESGILGVGMLIKDTFWK